MSASVTRHERFFIRERRVFDVIATASVHHENRNAAGKDAETERVVASCADYRIASDIMRISAERAASDMHSLDKSALEASGAVYGGAAASKSVDAANAVRAQRAYDAEQRDRQTRGD